MRGKVYTETVVYAPPLRLLKDAPYQLAIVDQEDGQRVTGRIEGERVWIGDSVELLDRRDGIPFFQRVGGSRA